jgi:crotonobetainyl-CoA:carnitine CoA-transferase CaiB-like acyl-CoA transferase
VQVLDQIRVIELGPGPAVAFAGKLYADFGADVIKVEPPGGDPTRRMGPFPGDHADPEHSAAYAFFNRNKRGVTLDPHHVDGQRILRHLAESADLILAAASLAELAEWGITLESLRAVQPGIVIASLTPWGEAGPYSGFAATMLVADAIAGPLSISGNPGRAPLSKPYNVVAAQVGNTFASTSLAAVMASRRAEEGQIVEVSATDVLMTCFDRRAICHIVYQVTGDIVTRPFGGASRSVLPAGRKQAKDGWVEMATMPIWVPRMLATLDDEALTGYFKDHPDFLLRPETAERIHPVLSAWLAARTRKECFEQAVLQHGWPVYPVNEPRDVINDRHFVDRGTFVEFDHPVAGTQRQLGPPWRMADGGFEARRAAPTLGQHNDEVFAELGLADGELVRARALEVI